MFRADLSSRVRLPSGSGDEDITYHELIEIVGPDPVWLLHVLARAQAPGSPQRRCFAVRSIEQALDVLGQDQWQAQDLYLIRMDAMPPAPPVQLGWCRAIWECREPDDDRACWRIETDAGVMLLSARGTPLGRERDVRRRWFASASGRAREGAA